MEIISGLFMGMVGSLHCLGMCGPIAIAIPAKSNNRWMIFFESIAYNFGRIITYVVLGALIGLLGASLSIAGYQEIISIIAGSLLLLTIIFPKKWSMSISEIKLIKRAGETLKTAFAKVINLKSFNMVFLIGLLNGLLPCGLVYTALIAALAFGSVQGAMTFMFFFGLGTLPALAIVFNLKTLLPLGFRNKFKKFVPVGIGIVAVILILRGMSLNIPYVSPALPDKIISESNCCQHETH